MDAKDETIEEQKEKIEGLNDIISEKEKQIKNLRRKINLQKNSLPRALRCPHCGFEKIYKNGTYKIRPERLFEELKKRQRNRDNSSAVHLSSTLEAPFIHQRRRKKMILF